MESDKSKRETEEDISKPPYLQQLYDRPFLLLTAGLITMFAFYTAWGLVEVLTLPKATLP